ncbi:MAG: hypothetical protein ACW98D_21900 [Promethearchaeota archaeon]|jgi:hypothetical protein
MKDKLKKELIEYLEGMEKIAEESPEVLMKPNEHIVEYYLQSKEDCEHEMEIYRWAMVCTKCGIVDQIKEFPILNENIEPYFPDEKEGDYPKQ